MNGVIFRGNSPSFLRADEPAVHHAASEPGAAGLHPPDRPGGGILSPRNAEIRNNLCPGIEGVEEPHPNPPQELTAGGAPPGPGGRKTGTVDCAVVRVGER